MGSHYSLTFSALGARLSCPCRPSRAYSLARVVERSAETGRLNDPVDAARCCHEPTAGPDAPQERAVAPGPQTAVPELGAQVERQVRPDVAQELNGLPERVATVVQDLPDAHPVSLQDSHPGPEAAVCSDGLHWVGCLVPVVRRCPLERSDVARFADLRPRSVDCPDAQHCRPVHSDGSCRSHGQAVAGSDEARRLKAILRCSGQELA